MKIRRTPWLLLAALSLSSAIAAAPTGPEEERIGAAFVLALGRAPSASEIDQWAKQGRLSVAELVAHHRQQLRSDANAERAVVDKACADAFGREPTADEIAAGSGGDRTYTELMTQHVQWLGEHPAEYRLVLERAYRTVLRRPAFAEELAYWNAQPALSYALLAGCIENWARRNAPGLMATTGTATVSVNSAYLAAVRLSPAIAAEARAAAGLFPAGDADRAAAVGRNLLAAGAGGVVSNGGIHFVAAGGADLVIARNGAAAP